MSVPNLGTLNERANGDADDQCEYGQVDQVQHHALVFYLGGQVR